jgi:hypothetical protein
VLDISPPSQALQENLDGMALFIQLSKKNTQTGFRALNRNFYGKQ